MKYIKDIKAILLEIGMAFFGARVHEIWSEKRSLNDTENYSQNTSLTNSACFNHHDPLRFLSSARSSLVI